MAVIRVPGHWVQPPTNPVWYRSGAYGPPARRYEALHYVDTATGHWVPAPAAKGGKTTSGKTTSTKTTSGFDPYHPYLPPDYTGGLSDAQIQSNAHAYASGQVANMQAAIARQQAAAAAAAQRDEQTMGLLGQAQMGMISQIPANIQGIKDTAAAAMAQWGGGVAGAQQQQAQSEQAQNAAAVASQVGNTAQGQTQGLDAAGAAAAVQAMGGTIPAQQQIAEGQATASYAAGMPAVVARATQDQVAQRMAQAASTDADYRQQLLDAANQEGGIYQDALNNMYNLEQQKFGTWQAQQQMKIDAWNQQYKVWSDQQSATAAAQDTKFKQWLSLQQLKLSGGRLTLEQQKEEHKLQQQIFTNQATTTRLQQGQTRINQAGTRIAQAGANYYTDAQGRTVPKGYRFNVKGELIKVPTPAKPKAPPISSTPGGGRGIKLANDMASKFRGTPTKISTSGGKSSATTLPPKVDYGKAFIQIRDRLIGMGYKRPEAEAIAHNAMNTYYGNEFRPGKQRKKG